MVLKPTAPQVRLEPPPCRPTDVAACAGAEHETNPAQGLLPRDNGQPQITPLGRALQDPHPRALHPTSWGLHSPCGSWLSPQPSKFWAGAGGCTPRPPPCRSLSKPPSRSQGPPALHQLHPRGLEPGPTDPMAAGTRGGHPRGAPAALGGVPPLSLLQGTELSGAEPPEARIQRGHSPGQTPRSGPALLPGLPVAPACLVLVPRSKTGTNSLPASQLPRDPRGFGAAWGRCWPQGRARGCCGARGDTTEKT